MTFVNEDPDGQHWPITGLVNVRQEFPDGCESEGFNTCRGLAQGETWSHTFSDTGNYRYYDNLNPTSEGIITVREN